MTVFVTNQTFFDKKFPRKSLSIIELSRTKIFETTSMMKYEMMNMNDDE